MKCILSRWLTRMVRYGMLLEKEKDHVSKHVEDVSDRSDHREEVAGVLRLVHVELHYGSA
jgi:hypothetical protein